MEEINSSNRSEQLNVQIVDGKLVISIGIDLLCFAVENKENCDYTITDNDGFAKDILNELEIEDEEGTTLVHTLFDKVANEAVEHGSYNVKLIQEE
jgi:hypothetical protein